MPLRAGEIVEVGAHVSQAQTARMTFGRTLRFHTGEGHVHRTPRLVAVRIRARPRHPGRVGDHVVHPDLNIVRPITIPEHQQVPRGRSADAAVARPPDMDWCTRQRASEGYNCVPVKLFVVA